MFKIDMARKVIVYFVIINFIFVYFGCSTIKVSKKMQYQEEDIKELEKNIEKHKLEERGLTVDKKTGFKIAGGIIGSLALGTVAYFVFKEEITRSEGIKWDSMGIYMFGVFIITGWLAGFELGGIIYDKTNHKTFCSFYFSFKRVFYFCCPDS